MSARIEAAVNEMCYAMGWTALNHDRQLVTGVWGTPADIVAVVVAALKSDS